MKPIQPTRWMLPLLDVLGLKARDIVGFTNPALRWSDWLG